MVTDLNEYNGHFLFRTETDCWYLAPVFGEGAHIHDELSFMNFLSRISSFQLYCISEEQYEFLLQQLDENGTADAAKLNLEPVQTIPYSDFHGIEELMES